MGVGCGVEWRGGALVWAGSLALALAATGAQATKDGKGPVLEIAVIEDAALARPVQTLLAEAFARAGQPVVFRPMPLRRAEQEILAGRLDGDSARVMEFFELHPQLQRVRVPLREVGYFALFKPPCPARLEWHALAARPLAYLRGTHAVEAHLPEPQRRAAASFNELGRYLQEGVAEAAVMPLTPALARALPGQGLCHVAEPVLRRDLFLALHARHALLRPRLERALQALQAEGRTAAIWAQAEAGLRQWAVQRPVPAASNP